jgi:hypothetical protein
MTTHVAGESLRLDRPLGRQVRKLSPEYTSSRNGRKLYEIYQEQFDFFAPSISRFNGHGHCCPTHCSCQCVGG